MAGQNHHFSQYAPEKLSYAITRYANETNRLYGVLNQHLQDRDFIAGDYSIADMACYPWIVPYKWQGQQLEEFPEIDRWFQHIQNRPATITAYEKGKQVSQSATMTDENRKVLFGQTAKTQTS